jgi:large subunit ribosomal protein L25
MSEVNIKATKRTISTKSSVNQSRKNGFVPGIYYSKGAEPIPITLPELSLKSLVYTTETHLINLQIDDTEVKKSILKNIQFDPVTDNIVHFDFQGISLDQQIEIEVPVTLEGQSKGVKDGGLIQHTLHKLHVSCLPTDIPEHITLNVSNLGIGDSIHVKDIALDKVKILNNPNVIIVSVVMPRAVVEPTTSTEGEVEEKMEPEVIGKGKSTEDEE